MIEFTERVERKLRNAQAELVAEAGVGKVMDITNKSKSVVYRWGDADAPDLMSLPEAMRVEGYVRRPVVSLAMVDFLGCEISGAPARETVAGSLSVHAAELVEHVGRLVVEVARAKSDGVLTIAEATRLLDLLANAERIMPVIKDSLVAVQVGGPLKVVGAG